MKSIMQYVHDMNKYVKGAILAGAILAISTGCDKKVPITPSTLMTQTVLNLEEKVLSYTSLEPNKAERIEHLCVSYNGKRTGFIQGTYHVMEEPHGDKYLSHCGPDYAHLRGVVDNFQYREEINRYNDFLPQLLAISGNSRFIAYVDRMEFGTRSETLPSINIYDSMKDVFIKILPTNLNRYTKTDFSFIPPTRENRARKIDSLSFSNDGMQLVFCCDHPDKKNKTGIYLISFSEEYFSENPSHSKKIHTFPLTKFVNIGTGVYVTEIPESLEGCIPKISPDGDDISFIKWEKDAIEDIYLASREKGGNTWIVKKILNDINTKSTTAPSTYGNIVFAAKIEKDDYEVYLYNKENGSLTNISNNPASDVAPSISNDGTKVVWQRENGNSSSIYMAGLEHKIISCLSSEGNWSYEPIISGDGGMVFYTVADRIQYGYNELCKIDLSKLPNQK